MSWHGRLVLFLTDAIDLQHRGLRALSLALSELDSGR